MDIERYLHDVEAAHDEFQGGNIDATGEALQYAYQNDLIIDHRRNSFSLTHLFGNLIRTTFPRTGEDAFTDYTHLAKLEVPDILIRENISLTNPAFILTCEACQAPRDEEVDVLARRLLESTSTRRHRMELPILRSDNDWDLRKFKSEQLARLHVTIKGHGLPPDTPDKDSGEGMELAANIRSESELFFQNLQREKLGVTRDGLKFLADQLKFDITVDDLMNYLIGEVKYDKVRWDNSLGLVHPLYLLNADCIDRTQHYRRSPPLSVPSSVGLTLCLQQIPASYRYLRMAALRSARALKQSKMLYWRTTRTSGVR